MDYRRLYEVSVKENINSDVITTWRTKSEEIINYLEGLPNRNELNILELGSGRGFFIKYLRDRGFRIIGSDFNKENLKLAKKINNVSLEFIDAMNISLNKAFDIVVSIELIEHLPNVRLHIKQIKKILKKGGTYCFTTPNVIVERVYKTFFRKNIDKFHISLQSFATIKNLLENENFEVDFIRLKKLRKSQTEKLGKLRFLAIFFKNLWWIPTYLQPTITVIAKKK